MKKEIREEDLMNTPYENKFDILERDFREFERVRRSGKMNMFGYTVGTKERTLYIMTHYDLLLTTFN